jgi:hypothetical protein
MATIKKIILLALIALMMVECMKTKEDGEPILSDYYREHSVENPYIQVLDSCEYICWNSRMAHKGNCRFCKERRQKELEELVIKLKEK